MPARTPSATPSASSTHPDRAPKVNSTSSYLSPSTITPAYILFYDHIPHPPTYPATLAVFSHWYPSAFIDPLAAPDSGLAGVVYPTMEHWMMYHKARLFDPAHPQVAQAILDAPTPEEAKRLGRAVRGFDGERWRAVSRGVVRWGNRCKFHPECGGGGGGGQGERERAGREGGEGAGAGAEWRWDALRQTRGSRMVEASPTDRVWGIGFGVDEARGKESEWGRNQMGDALTCARLGLLKELEGMDEPLPPDTRDEDLGDWRELLGHKV